MCLKKVFAVALTAVFGVVGMVSAQAPRSPVAQDLTAPPTGELSVSYTVALEAEMVVEQRQLSGDALFVDPTTNYDNLGTIRVKTNYPLWDVEVEAQNGLALVSGGSRTMGAITPSPVPGGAPDTAWTVNGGTPLLKSGVAGTLSADTAYLQLTIGVVDLSSNRWVGGTGSYGNTTDFSTALKNVTNPVAFSNVIGTALASGSYNGQDGTGTGSIFADGFVTPVSRPSAGFTADENGWVTFYVGAGLGDGTQLKGKNPNGDYTETLTFTMIAGFQ